MTDEHRQEVQQRRSTRTGPRCCVPRPDSRTCSSSCTAPGQPASGPVAKPGYTIPVSNTLPDIDVDEILGSLDGDTRSYLDLLVNGAGQGLKGNGGDELAQVLERFEPTHRDLARLNKAVAVRGHDLASWSTRCSASTRRWPPSRPRSCQLVDASSKVFRAFASEDDNISKSIVDSAGHAEPDHRDAGQGGGVRQAARDQRPPTCCRRHARSRPPTTRSRRWRCRARRSSATRSGRSWSPPVRWCETSSPPRSTWPRRRPT